MNKKLIFALLTSLFILSGCSQNSNETIESPKYKKETRCVLENYKPETNSDGIIEYAFSIRIFYNKLDDKEAYLKNYSYTTFNSWDNAKKYYDNHKNEYKDLDVELSEENVDTDNTGDITTYTEGVEENTPRKIIEEQKTKGFICTTSNNE